MKKLVKHEWTQIATVLITIMGLFLWTQQEYKCERRDIMHMIKSIEKEMKDFHGRLERQDAEFKAGLLLIEQKISSRKP